MTVPNGRRLKRGKAVGAAELEALGAAARSVLSVLELDAASRRKAIEFLILRQFGGMKAKDTPVRDADNNVRAVVVPFVRYNPIDAERLIADHDRSKQLSPSRTLGEYLDRNRSKARDRGAP